MKNFNLIEMGLTIQGAIVEANKLKVTVNDVEYVPSDSFSPRLAVDKKPEKWVAEKEAFDRDEIIEFRTPCSRHWNCVKKSDGAVLAFIDLPDYEYRIKKNTVKKWIWARRNMNGFWDFSETTMSLHGALPGVGYLTKEQAINQHWTHKLEFTEIEVNE